MKFLCASCERLVAASSFRMDAGALLLTCSRCGAENPLDLQSPGTPPRSADANASPSTARSTQASAQSSLRASSPSGELMSPGSMPGSPGSPPPTFAASTSPPPASSPSAPRVVALRPVTDAVKLAAEAAETEDPFSVPPDRCPKCVGTRSESSETCPHCGLAFINFNPAEAQPSPALAEAFRDAMRAWDDAALQDRALALATERGELPQLGRLYRIRLVAAPLDPVAQRGRDEVVRRASAAGEAMRQLDKSAEPRTPRWQIALLVLLLIGVFALMGVLVRQLSAG